MDLVTQILEDRNIEMSMMAQQSQGFFQALA